MLITNRDAEELASFRGSFRPAFELVFATAKERGYEPSGRFGKTTPSIIAKLRREKTRLTSMQDIAGLPIVVDDVQAQNMAVTNLQKALRELASCRVYDRRANPKFGYRAVHLVFHVDKCPVEVQIRTKLQHYWAELSEKLADVDPEIKYGGGLPNSKELLERAARMIRNVEEGPPSQLPEAARKELEKAVVDGMAELVESLEEFKRRRGF